MSISRLTTARPVLAACLLVMILAAAAPAGAAGIDTADPVVYLNFNEGSGLVALDASGHGNAGTIHNASREIGGCGGAVVFDREYGFVSIPYRTANHPEKEVTVSLFFFADPAAGPQDILSTCHDGGWCLGFGDGGDLWWTVHTRDDGEVAVSVQREGITPGVWHHLAGMYDGKTVKVYLDGVLRNSANATGPIVYTVPNYIIAGAQAGAAGAPDPACPRSFRGGIDELRIYDRAVPYTRIMDDRFGCPQELVMPAVTFPAGSEAGTSCAAHSGSLVLGPEESAMRRVTVPDKTTTGTWQVAVRPGSVLEVQVLDRNQEANPDAWYVEIADGGGRIDRSIAFPNTRNTPVDGIIRDGNATVSIRYFDGRERFPASADVRFTTGPAPVIPEPPKTILNYPIIVIYSASWATLIALILVFVWLRKRHRERKAAQEGQKE
jgi:hypothetical protein